MEKYVQPSFLKPNSTQIGGEIVSLNRQAEADLLLKTPEQREAALALIREGKADSIRGAIKLMREEDLKNPTNDAFEKKD